MWSVLESSEGAIPFLCFRVNDCLHPSGKLGMADYEEVPYIGLPIPNAHPDRLAWTAHIFGGPKPNMNQARVLELGCGDGASLLPLAGFNPEWTLHGIDASPRAIQWANEVAVRSGLENITFTCADLAEVTIEPGTWDFVIAHGLYSWIDPTRRDQLRRLIRKALAPTGLAYVSFNAMPGWAMRGLARKLLMDRPLVDPKEALDASLARIPDTPWGRLLGHELRLARDARLDYLTHEYLAPHNDAFWLRHFVADMAQAGLRWLGDSQFDQVEGRGFESIRLEFGIPGLEGEEHADILGGRQFHCAVLARDDAPERPPLERLRILDEAYISGSVTPSDATFVFDRSQISTMRSAEGVEILVEEPLGKAALIELARIDPNGITLTELFTNARELLQRNGVAFDGPAAETEVAEGVLRLWRMGVLSLRVRRGNVTVSMPARPAIPRFLRVEAEVRGQLSTPLAGALPLDSVATYLLPRIDGTRTPEQLGADAVYAEKAGDFVVTEANLETEDEIATYLRRRTLEFLTELAHWGLLAPLEAER